MALPFLSLALIIVGFPCDIYLRRPAQGPPLMAGGRVLFLERMNPLFMFFLPKIKMPVLDSE